MQANRNFIDFEEILNGATARRIDEWEGRFHKGLFRLSQPEAATVLGVTAKAIELRVSRARRRLAPTLDCGLIFGETHTHDDETHC